MNLNYESGKVGDYKGTPVYTIEEIKFDPKRANRNFIYALGHQGTSEKLNLIFWDGNVWRHLGTGSDRPNSFGKTEVEKEEDWLVEMKKSKSNEPLENVKTIRVEEIEEIEDLTTLSAGIRVS